MNSILEFNQIIYFAAVVFVGFYLYKYIFKALLYAYKNDLKFSGKLNYLFIFREIFVKKEYDNVLPNTTPSRIFDIGGNIGLYTLYLNTNYDNLEIHVFEPSPSLYKNLSHNVNRNKKPSNTIILNEVGLSNTTEEMNINYFPNASGLSTFRSDLDTKQDLIIESRCKNTLFPGLCSSFFRILSKSHYVALQEKAKLIRLSDYINSHNIDKIDIVKIDVEGYELQILQGIDDRHFPLIDSLMIEVENYREGYQDEIVSILKKHDYRISIVGGDQSWSFITANREKILK